MDYKQTIIDALDVMRRKEVAAGKANNAVFKARAYADAIRILKSLGAVRTMDDVRGVKGLGEKILLKIGEILETGRLRAAEEIKAEGSLGIYDALLACYGIGPVRARELVDLGVSGIEDLRRRSAADIGLLNDKQRIGLKYYEDLIQRIPRVEMLEHEALLYKSHWKVAGEGNKGSVASKIVGSFRRGAASSGDIDMLVLGNDPRDLERFVEELKRIGYLTEILAQGDKKCLGICRLSGGVARRLDLLLTPPEEWGYAILYFTGSDTFNVSFRSRALELGYTLNEHGMKPIRDGVPPCPPCLTEKAIFGFLGIDWVDPCKRDGIKISA